MPVPNTFSPTTIIDSNKVNENFQSLDNDVSNLLNPSNNKLKPAALNLIRTSKITKSWVAAEVSGLSVNLIFGSANNGAFYVTMVLDISSFNIPSDANIMSYNFWYYQAKDVGNLGYVPVFCAQGSTHNTVQLYGVVIGNGSGVGFPNTTNSKVEGYVIYSY